VKLEKKNIHIYIYIYIWIFISDMTSPKLNQYGKKVTGKKKEKTKKMTNETNEKQEQEEQEQKPEAQKLDMTKYGTSKFESGGGKPLFEKMTKMTVKEAVFKVDSEIKTSMTKDGEVSKYCPIFLSVTFQYMESGEKKECFENYGGARQYGSGIDGVKFWLGEKSALGKLTKLLKETMNLDLTLSDIPAILVGKDVGVRTDTFEVAGKTINKNIIKNIYI